MKQGRLKSIVLKILVAFAIIGPMLAMVIAAAPSWTPISGQENNMVAYGDLYVGGVKVNKATYIVGAFGPGGTSTDCRAVGNSAANGTYYLTIVGNTNGDKITFKVYDPDAGVGGTIYDVTESFNFLANDTQTISLHAVDTIPPVVSSFVMNPNRTGKVVKAETVTFTIYFSESMDHTVAPTVTFGTPAKVITGAYTNATTWVGTYPIVAGYDGSQTVSISGAKDLSGNTMVLNAENTFVVKAALPVTTATTPSATPVNTNYFKADFNVLLTADATTALIYYTTDGTTPTTSLTPATGSITIPIAVEKQWTIKYFAVDTVGNQEAVKTSLFVLDKTKPVTNPSIPAGTYGTAQTVTLTVTDANPDKTYAQLFMTDPGAPSKPTTLYTAPIALAAPAQGLAKDYWIVYYSIDKAANEDAAATVGKYTIDTRAPVTNVTFSNPQPIIYNGVAYAKAVGTIVTLSSSGNTIYYTMSSDGSDPAVPTETSDSFPGSGSLSATTGAGTYKVKYFAKNTTTGLVETITMKTLIVDLTAPAAPVVTPTVTTPTNAQPQTIGGTKDADTAIWASTRTTGPVAATSAGTTWSYSQPLIEGSNTFTVKAADAAGNESATVPVTILYDITKPATSGWNPAKNAIGQPLNKPVIAHITDAGSGVDDTSIKINVAGVEYLYNSARVAIDKTNPMDVIVTFTPPAIYAASTSIPVKIDAKDKANNAMVQDSYAFQTGASVGVTPKPIGVATGATFTFTAQGGSVPYVWTKTDPTGGSSTITKKTDTTAEFVATVVGAYKVKVTDETTAFSEADADVIAPIVIGGKPAKDAKKSGGTCTFTATGGKTSGQVNWEVTAGSITAAGDYTAPTVTAATRVTVTAYDKTWAKSTVSPVLASYEFTVYPTVAITNKPAAPPVVNAGENSILFKAGGGDGTYNWTVTDPGLVIGAPVTAAEYQFKAPATGSFAGKYTIKVTDGKDFFDSFDLYVPLKIVAWDMVGGKVIKPVLNTGGANYGLNVLGVATGTSLTLTKEVAASKVLTLPTSPTTSNPFAVAAFEPGVENVTVRVTDDTNGNYKGGIRIDVLGVATLTGTIGGIPTSPKVDPTTVRVELLDPATKTALDAAVYGTTNVAINAQGVYTFTGLPAAGGLPWQAYWLQVTVNDPQYVSVVTGKRILVSSAAAVENVTLPAMTTLKCTLTVNLPAPYAAGDVLTYKFYLASSGNVMLEGTATTNPFTVELERKNYRLIITGAKYLPFEYEDATEPKKFVKIAAGDLTQAITANLTALLATVTASHDQVGEGLTGGFTLKVVTKNFTGAYAYSDNAVGTTTLVSVGADGSEAKPYVYNWTPTGGGVVDALGNTTYTVDYTFTNGGTAVKNPDGTAYTYTATYIVYASEKKKDEAKQASTDTTEKDHWNDQKQAAGDNTTLSVTLGEMEFFPLIGTNVTVTLKDVTDAERVLTVVIPPMPLEYLFKDDYDKNKPGDNLKYGGLKSGATPGTDRYAQTRALAANITATDILRAKVEYVTIGGGSLSNSVSISFETRDGIQVRYNPILEGGRLANAPVISLPLLLNPKAILYKSLKKLSQAKGALQTMVSEIGDGQNGFKVENLAFTIQDDGLVWIDIPHLSSVSLGSIGGGGETSSSGCFIATAAYGSYFEKHVQILRNFRDVYLLTNDWGRAFVGFYYRHSPAIADVIARNGGLRAAVRLGLAPVVGVAYVTIHTTPVQKVLILLFLIGIMAVGMVMILRTRKFRRVIG